MHGVSTEALPDAVGDDRRAVPRSLSLPKPYGGLDRGVGVESLLERSLGSGHVAVEVLGVVALQDGLVPPALSIGGDLGSVCCFGDRR
jgi:hypothetical protein